MNNKVTVCYNNDKLKGAYRPEKLSAFFRISKNQVFLIIDGQGVTMNYAKEEDAEDSMKHYMDIMNNG